MELPNVQAPPMVHIDTTDLVRIMAIMMAKKEKQKKLGDIIEHAKKCRTYDFYRTLDLGQADKWVKTVEKAFTTLQLTDRRES